MYTFVRICTSKEKINRDIPIKPSIGMNIGLFIFAGRITMLKVCIKVLIKDDFYPGFLLEQTPAGEMNPNFSRRN